MNKYFQAVIEPKRKQLARSLGIREIPVRFEQSEHRALYGYGIHYHDRQGNPKSVHGRHFELKDSYETPEPDFDKDWKERNEF